MTYQHALAYLAERSTKASLLPTDRLPTPDRTASPLVVCFSHDKQGSAAAQLLRAALTEEGIGVLHVIDADELALRERYLLGGKPILPTLLCPAAHEMREKEIKLRRALSAQGQADTTSIFSPAHRALTVLLRCMQSEGARVLLLEGEQAADDLRTLCELLHTVTAITLVSTTDEGGQSALGCIQGVTREVISHPAGAALFRTLSDACSKTGSRLGIIARSAHSRCDVTLGSQSISYATLTDCRLRSGSTLAADAAVLAAEGLFALRRAGLAISNDAIRQGFAKATLTSCTTPVAIHPPVVAELVTNKGELVLVMHDLELFSALLPRPRRVVLEASLQPFFAPYAAFADVICADMADDDAGFGCTVCIGSAEFLRHASHPNAKK